MKLISLCKGKIHRATVTQCELDYVGSVTVDEDLLEAAGIVEGEQVHVWNVTNGQRLETYAILGERGSGVVCLNGAAAHMCNAGDKVIITSFCWTDEPIERKVVLVDDDNKIVSRL